MKCGSGGNFGRGIYFAWNATDAKRRAQHGNDTVLAATVTLNKPVRLFGGWTDLTYDTLRSMGFDSVVHECSSGNEIVVYTNDVIQLP
jgi:hypothetical protein